MNGFIIADKPKGKSSFWVVERIRRLSGQRKVGHAGTLDPLASGVLVLCLGEATKLSDYVMDEDKVYEVSGKLGERTNTLDAEGDIIETKDLGDIKLDKAKLELVLDDFRGWIEQLPPMHSAVKKDGAPLYRLARRGQSVERQKRKVFISKLELLNLELPFYTLRVTCSKGTYIRTLIDDIGERLGVGSYVADLRRIRSGSFDIKDAVEVNDSSSPEDLKTRILSMESVLDGVLPVEDVPYELAKKISDGYSLQELDPVLADKHEKFALMSVLDGRRSLTAVIENRKTARVFNHRLWSNNVQ